MNERKCPKCGKKRGIIGSILNGGFCSLKCAEESQKKEVKRSFRSKKEAKIDIKKTCMEWGIGLLIAGIIPFIFSELLDITVGIIALLLGVITLVFRRSWNIAVIGAFIILIGAWNIIIVLTSQTQYVFLIVGVVQILIGVGALNQYHKIDNKKN